MKFLRVPLLVFALPAVLVAFAHGAHDSLVLGRDALLHGEIWRLWTGHWVHFSASHLGWNLLVLLAAGTWLEYLRPGLLLRHALAAPPLIGLAVLSCEPALGSYGGLSGLATGVVVLLALHQWHSPGAERWVWMSVLILVAIKCVADLLQLSPGIVRYDEFAVRTSTTAHAAGASIAALHHFLSRQRQATPPVAPELV